MKRGINRLLYKIIGLVLLCALVFGAIWFAGRRPPEISSEMVISKMEAAGELTTARLTYNGLVHYEEGEIPFLTKKAFFMVYTAEVTAGFDLSRIQVQVTKEEVRILVPEPEIRKVHVYPESIEFHDEMKALFNWESKQDGIDAIAAAEADVLEKAAIEELAKTAKNQCRILLESLFADAIGDRSLVIQFQ